MGMPAVRWQRCKAPEPDIDQQDPGKNCFGDGSPEPNDLHDRTKECDTKEKHCKMIPDLFTYACHSSLNQTTAGLMI
jgi:hypothetical protein